MLTDTIAGLPVADLADEFGTPLFVYDQSIIEQRMEEVLIFGTVRFAMKALPNLAILALARKKGLKVDCVSQGEAMRALAAGFSPAGDPPGIAYTCDIFDRRSLAFVVEHKIQVNMGSTEMIRQYGPVAPRKDIVLRINPGFGHGHSHKTNTGGPSSKHGIWHEELPAALAAAKEQGLTVAGLHLHIGSGTDFKHLSQVCDAMRTLARQVGPSLKSISAGGGLPVAYKEGQERIDFSQYRELWQQVRRELEAEFGHPMNLELEPGRFLVAESGCLVTEIRAVKHQGQNRFYIVDAGFNNLVRPSMYGSYHKITICRRSGKQGGGDTPTVIGGPLCESGDIFTQLEGGMVDPRPLPDAAVGDLLLLHTAGAYGSSMGSNYNSKPHAAEVLIHEGKAHCIRERQPESDIFQYDRIPSHLS